MLVNPLHAAEPLPHLEPSPYLPSSRRFFNPLYLRVEDIPEYAELPPARRAMIDQIRAQVPSGSSRDSAIERDPAWSAKLAALLLVHGVERSPERARAFAEFRAREGDALLQFATWSVLAEDHGNDARDWPEELRDMDSQAVADLATRHVGRIGFAMWLQWVLDEQLTRPGAAPRRSPQACGSAPCTTSRSGCTPAARTPGGCLTCTPRECASARRPTPTTSWARTGASHRGAPTGSPSSPTSRSAS